MKALGRTLTRTDLDSRPAILLLQSTSNATTSAIPSIKHQLSDDETAPISKRIRVRSSSVKSVSDKSKEKGKAKQKVKYEPDEEGDSSDVEILDPVIKQKKLNRDPQDRKHLILPLIRSEIGCIDELTKLLAANMAVKCPICNAKMPNSQLDRHINSNCGSNDTGSKSAWGNLMGSRQSEKKSSKGKAVVKQKSP